MDMESKPMMGTRDKKTGPENSGVEYPGRPVPAAEKVRDAKMDTKCQKSALASQERAREGHE